VNAPAERDWLEVYLPHAREAFAPGAAFDSYYAGSGLWTPMVTWIYGGQADWAWRLVDASWPEGKPNKDEFLKEFCGQLAKSEYWEDLRTQIGSPPPACAAGLAETRGIQKP